MLFIFANILITIHYFLFVIDDHINISKESILHDGSSDSISSENDGGIMPNKEFDMFFEDEEGALGTGKNEETAVEPLSVAHNNVINVTVL